MTYARLPTVPRACPVCGTEFQATEKSTKKFCSKACKSKDQYASRDHAVFQAATRDWRKENPEKAKEYARRSYLKFQERRRADRIAYYEANKDSINAKRALAYKKKSAAHIVLTARYRAEKKGLPFALDDAWLAAHWTGACGLTGIPFVTNPNGRGGPWMYSPSIDKIDPAKGYVPDNCRFILLAVNALKGVGTDEDMYRIAGAILANRP